jgi:hypothetical protein
MIKTKNYNQSYNNKSYNNQPFNELYDIDIDPNLTIPLVFEIPNNPCPINIDELEPDIKLSNNIDYPLFSLGFNHIIHQNKDKMEIINEFKKNPIYQVCNSYERYINNYPDSFGKNKFIKECMGMHGRTFFNIGDKNQPPDILSRGFYKIWEILNMFNLIDINKTNFRSVHLAEGPGSFIQATMFYREKFAKKNKDMYYGITLHSEGDGENYVPALGQAFIDYYYKEPIQRFFLHKTYPKHIAKLDKNKDDGDLTNPKTARLLSEQLGEDKMDFITADGGFEWSDETVQEQEAFRLVFSEIYNAMRNQNKGGHFVCKLFETYTDTSTKFIYLLGQMYEKIYLVKPLTGRPANSEKYIVCMNFKYTDKDKFYKNIMKKLDKVFEDLFNNSDLNLIEIWKSLDLSKKFLHAITLFNTRVANTQVKYINAIVSFLREQNYFGEKYVLYRNLQIQSNKYWINKFMNLDNQEDQIKNTIKETKELIEYNNKLIN